LNYELRGSNNKLKLQFIIFWIWQSFVVVTHFWAAPSAFLEAIIFSLTGFNKGFTGLSSLRQQHSYHSGITDFGTGVFHTVTFRLVYYVDIFSSVE
jgi:hypothetical protein